MNPNKPLPITKAMVWKAYQQVKRNGKAAGVDGQSFDDFAKDLENNLYKLWNRMASGSYFPRICSGGRNSPSRTSPRLNP
jgi:retron-type reverse transcriptase